MTTPVLEKPIPPVPSAQTLDSRGSIISQPWQQWFINLRDKVNQINGVVVAISGSNTTLGAFNTLSPLTTSGDILSYSAGSNVRIPIGSTGQILSVVSGEPKWIDPPSSTSPLTTKGDLFGYNTASARVPVGTDSYVLTADSSNPLGVSWKPAGTPTLPVTTKGDLLGYSTLPARIPVGIDGQVLTADSTNALGVSWKGGGGNYDSVVLADTPAGYWKLNETSGTTVIDSSGNARNGTYTGGFTLGKSMGNLDGAVQLDGSSGYATIPYAAWMDFVTAWSVEIWLVPFTFGTALVSRSFSSTSIEYVLTLLSGSSFATTSGFGVGKYTGSAWNTVTLTNNGSIFSVYHMVGTFDGTTMSLYINGNLAGAVAYSGFNTAPNPFYIGRRWDNGVSGTIYFNGLLSSCALYATALSPSRILVHYNAGK